MQTTRTMRSWRTTLVAAALLVTAGTSLAGDVKKPRKGAHLEYRRTYADALLEARIRNVPVFFSRQKDF